MKIILAVDVPGLGKKGEQCEVKEGYARNYLLPQKMALLPQDPEAKVFSGKIAEVKVKTASTQAAQAEKIKALDGKEIIFEVKVNKKGTPYSGIQSKDIAAKIGIDEVLLGKRLLKTLGEHQIKIKDSILKVIIVAETAKK